MEGLSGQEAAAVERCADTPMLAKTEGWSTVNSGSRNLDGLASMAEALAGAFSVLPGEVELKDAAPVKAIDADGRTVDIPHGRTSTQGAPRCAGAAALHGPYGYRVAADHAFQNVFWRDEACSAGRAWPT